MRKSFFISVAAAIGIVSLPTMATASVGNTYRASTPPHVSVAFNKGLASSGISTTPQVERRNELKVACFTRACR